VRLHHVQAALRKKLGEDIEDCLVLGTCNPPLARRAFQDTSSLPDRVRAVGLCRS